MKSRQDQWSEYLIFGAPMPKPPPNPLKGVIVFMPERDAAIVNLDELSDEELDSYVDMKEASEEAQREN